MGAKIFISWSGELSKALAEVVRDWIPKVLQSVKPYFTPDDIEKGSRWAKEISGELATSQLGIICLTQDNQHSPWILFEAGALSKNLEDSKVCPILFNFDTTELKGPLASFQATKFTKEDIKKLLESINNSCNESKLEEKSLEETFEMWWPQLEGKIKEILAQAKSTTKVQKRPDRDILEEILELTRSNAKLVLSDQRGTSTITIEELVTRYRAIKEKVATGQSMEADLILLESAIIRLCKEMNLEDVYFRRIGYHPMGLRRFSGAHVEKNSVIEGYPIKRKMSGEDTDGLKRKTELE